ncbi:MAG: ATP-dependent DNA ligase [Methanothermobacter sp.]
MIEPMLAKLADQKVHLNGNWISEPKYDGQRLMAEYDGQTLKLWTRRHIQIAKKFPELTESLKKDVESNDWILDGELTVPGGLSNLINRNVEDELRIKILAKKIPATYHIFDIIKYEGKNLINQPLMKRKKILLKAVHQDEHLEIVPFKIMENSKIKDDFKEYTEKGFEGAILKNIQSRYEPGKRTGEWIKIKREDTVDVNIIGATKSENIPFGALLMEKDGKYFGKVGTGFSDQEREDILKLLKMNEAPLHVHVPPDIKGQILITTKPLFAEIKVNELIRGRSPRAPVWVRFRWD